MCLVTDASDVGIGRCLFEIDDSRIRPLGWYSRKLTNAERSYDTREREALVIKESLLHFKD